MVVRTIDRFGGRWWLVHTKSRCEKALAARLDRMGIGYFLPLARVQRTYAGRTTHVSIPLFPSYLFLCGGEDERYATLMTHQAANIIDVADQEHLKADLEHISRVVSSKQPVDVYPGIREGRHCRVARGCLTGLEGVVLRRRGVCRVYVAVDALGQSLELEIDASLLESIE